MTALRLQLPTIQNWSCHSCAGCCRQHLIEITDEERRRIEGQNWSAEDGVSGGRPVTVWHAGLPWKKRYRLAHQADGACVFLNEQGLCRIHAKFGEAAKPLACRIYPYAFHPAGRDVAVSLRFSCPSVVANRGRPLAESRGEIREIAEAVIPAGRASRAGGSGGSVGPEGPTCSAERATPPAISARERVEWPDLMRFVRALDATLAEDDAPISVRLTRAVFWTGLVDQSRFDAIQGDRLAEFLSLIRDAARSEVPADVAEKKGTGPFCAQHPAGRSGKRDLSPYSPPTRLGRLYFRMHVAQYARRDTLADLAGGWRGRWKLLRAAIRFARGSGDAVPLQEAFRLVPFETLERPFGLPGGGTDEAEELLTRYFRVKVQGLHFCGRAFYGVPFVEGLYSLALMLPIVGYLARWLAAGAGRDRLAIDDIAQALAVADHHHGYSPALGAWPARRRVRSIARQGDLPRLISWYAGNRSLQQ